MRIVTDMDAETRCFKDVVVDLRLQDLERDLQRPISAMTDVRIALAVTELSDQLLRLDVEAGIVTKGQVQQMADIHDQAAQFIETKYSPVDDEVKQIQAGTVQRLRSTAGRLRMKLD